MSTVDRETSACGPLDRSAAGSACVDLPAPLTVAPMSRRCEACVADGREWVSVRVCLECGHVGCCDNSPGRHATGHNESSGHPVITSGEPGERWQWCFDHAQSWSP
jgi:CPA1 family monovalent cation:H+ antiporter